MPSALLRPSRSAPIKYELSGNVREMSGGGREEHAAARGSDHHCPCRLHCELDNGQRAIRVPSKAEEDPTRVTSRAGGGKGGVGGCGGKGRGERTTMPGHVATGCPPRPAPQNGRRGLRHTTQPSPLHVWPPGRTRPRQQPRTTLRELISPGRPGFVRQQRPSHPDYSVYCVSHALPHRCDADEGTRMRRAFELWFGRVAAIW